MARAIDADKAIEVAQIKYNDWNLAMAAADGQREINLCFKKQELFKAVKAVLECVPTLTPPNEPVTLEVLAKSQLLQMLGEKVEVIRMGEMCQKEWATVRSFGDCKTDSGCLCCHELYGKTWIAYRRPPEGEANG